MQDIRLIKAHYITVYHLTQWKNYTQIWILQLIVINSLVTWTEMRSREFIRHYTFNAMQNQILWLGYDHLTMWSHTRSRRYLLLLSSCWKIFLLLIWRYIPLWALASLIIDFQMWSIWYLRGCHPRFPNNLWFYRDEVVSLMPQTPPWRTRVFLFV
jgi:hypothetical protein